MVLFFSIFKNLVSLTLHGDGTMNNPFVLSLNRLLKKIKSEKSKSIIVFMLVKSYTGSENEIIIAIK